MEQDPELLAYLRSKGLPVSTADDLRRTIEDSVLRAGIEALTLFSFSSRTEAFPGGLAGPAGWLASACGSSLGVPAGLLMGQGR